MDRQPAMTRILSAAFSLIVSTAMLAYAIVPGSPPIA